MADILNGGNAEEAGSVRSRSGLLTRNGSHGAMLASFSVSSL